MFQDWTPIVFSSKRTTSTTSLTSSSSRPKNFENTRENKLANETDVPVLNSIDSETKNKIISMRNAKGLTQAQLAQKLNVDKSVIVSYESGKAIPNKNFIQKIYRVLA